MTERDLEAPETDLGVQHTTADRDGVDAGDSPVEVDPADRVELQRAVTVEDDGLEDDGMVEGSGDSSEVDPADRADQQRAVAIDDDEYR